MSIPGGLEFLPESHIYQLNGRRLLSVTQILQLAGLVDTQWYSEWAAERGSVIHKATELDDLGELDEESVDERIAGYLEAWRNFKRENEWRSIDIELMMADEAYGYAGTLDRAGQYDGKVAILDVKTGAKHRAVGLQLTGYAKLYAVRRNVYVAKILGVYLSENGKYQVKPYPVDFATWDAAVTVAQWKNEG